MESDLTRAVAPYVNSTFGYNQKVMAAAYGMAYITSQTSSGYSLRFQDQARIFRVGTGEETAPAPGFVTVTFCDPATGVCYGAHVDVTDTDPGLGPRLILRALNHAAAFPPGDPAIPYAVEPDVQDLELMRTLFAEFGHVYFETP